MMLRVSVCKEASWKKKLYASFLTFHIFFFFSLSNKFNVNFTACLTLCTDRALQIISVCTELSALWDGMYFFSLIELLIFQRARDWNLAGYNVSLILLRFKLYIISTIFIRLDYDHQIPVFLFS